MIRGWYRYVDGSNYDVRGKGRNQVAAKIASLMSYRALTPEMQVI